MKRDKKKNNKLEYSCNKVILHGQKCSNILKVYNKEILYDESLPISIELHLTNKCNLNCRWCVDKEIRRDRAEIKYEVLLKFLDDIKDKGVGLTIEGGGEPTVYPFFNEFIIEAGKRNIELGLITNGVKRINPELIKYFKWIRVSLDSSNREEYKIEKGLDCFDKVMCNIKFLCESKKDTLIGVSYVLTESNYKNIIPLLKELGIIGVDNVQIRAVEECNKYKINEEIMNKVKEDINKNLVSQNMYINLNTTVNSCRTDNNKLPCIAHSLRSIIHADGDVYLCEKRRHDIIIIGNIIKDSFIDIWNSEKHKEASQKLMDFKNQNGCYVCRITKFNEMFIDLCNTKTRNFI
ncbi:radical SAM protein [uncultured Clostridium sp.]|uniref:radical SAM protein n=1 Tax=uncultured Clostridium sp. TaxID=59620 RepID=UPI0025FB7592|nr:radical SAM protein [uncultured Clostridium sp.]